eukprot:COSAG03_NODE_337_length_8860_cov_33.996690_6_plen_60_part_00
MERRLAARGGARAPRAPPVLLACSAGWGARQGMAEKRAGRWPHFALTRMPIGKSSLLTR